MNWLPSGNGGGLYSGAVKLLVDVATNTETSTEIIRNITSIATYCVFLGFSFTTAFVSFLFIFRLFVFLAKISSPNNLILVSGFI